jgi:hypothetical protein
VKGSTTVGGPNGHRSNGSEIEGRPDPRLKAGVPNGVLDGAGRGARRDGQTGWPDGVVRWGARRGQMECPTGPDGVARRGARRGPDGVPGGVGRRGGQTGCRDEARRSARRGQTGCPTGPDGVPDGWPDGVARWGARRVARRGARRGQTGATSLATSFFECHVIGHVIFECHITHLGWQGVILLPTLVSQRLNASLILRRPYCVVTGGSVTSRRVTTSRHRHKVTIDNVAFSWVGAKERSARWAFDSSPNHSYAITFDYKAVMCCMPKSETSHILLPVRLQIHVLEERMLPTIPQRSYATPV